MTLCKRHERHIFATSEVRSRGEMGPWDVVGVDCTMRTITLFYVKSSLSVSMMGTDIIWFHIWCMYIYTVFNWWREKQQWNTGHMQQNGLTVAGILTRLSTSMNRFRCKWWWQGSTRTRFQGVKELPFHQLPTVVLWAKKTCQVNKLPWNNGRKILIHPIMNEIPSMDVANLRW